MVSILSFVEFIVTTVRAVAYFLQVYNKNIIIPPVYEVYRGYIVFAFSVTMFVCLCVCVCVCVNFFSVKDFSGTTCHRILKFGTKLCNDKLYCV